MSDVPAGSRGFVLLDALVAVLIFSFGILGIVALQANATKLGGDAKYRSDAALLADRVIADMWGSDPATLVNFKTDGTAYVAWRDNLVSCAKAKVLTNCLPGITDKANQPTITLDANNLVTVTIKWQGPQDTSPHQYVSVSQIIL